MLSDALYWTQKSAPRLPNCCRIHLLLAKLQVKRDEIIYFCLLIVLCVYLLTMRIQHTVHLHNMIYFCSAVMIVIRIVPNKDVELKNLWFLYILYKDIIFLYVIKVGWQHISYATGWDTRITLNMIIRFLSFGPLDM